MKKAPPVQDPQIYKKGLMEKGVVYPIPAGRVTVYSNRSPLKDSDNEDSAAVIPMEGRSAIFVVADGVGGHRAGVEASGIAVEKIRQAIKSEPDPHLRVAILNGFEAANRAVMDLGMGAATTLSVVEIQKGIFRFYHVGDSLMMVVGQRGKIKYQSIPHSPTGYAVEAGLMSEKEALEHEESHIVSNVVGSEDMRIEIGPKIKLSARDTLLLASDGLSDNLQTSEIVERIRKGKLEQGSQLLIKESSARMVNPVKDKPSKPDDLTFILFRSGDRQ